MKRYNFIKGMNSNLELSDKERRRILRRSVEKDPWKLKCTIAMEEFAELQQQVSKEIRGYGFLLARYFACMLFLLTK